MKEQITIRPLQSSDIQVLASLANNQKIADNLKDYFPYPYTEKDAEDFIKLTEKENPKQNFGIEYKGKLCGVIGLKIQKDIYRKSGEIGYWIGEAYWGKGIATKAVAIIMNYGFEHLKLNRIFARVFETNTASMKVLENNGFNKEGILKNAVIKNGKMLDEHRYDKLKA